MSRSLPEDPASLAWHNVASLEPCVSGGWWLRRFPSQVRQQLSPNGQQVSSDSAGCEFRFVSEAELFRLSLACGQPGLETHEYDTTEVLIYRGAFFHSRHVLSGSGVHEITVSDIGGSEQAKFSKLADADPAISGSDWFSPRVWRVFFGRFPARLISLETDGADWREPLSTELPQLRWLAYGSSITHGYLTLSHHNAYVYHAARRLKADVHNLGLASSALCEKTMAEYLAKSEGWDFATLELGINMRGSLPLETAIERAEYLIDAVKDSHQNKRVFVIGIYPNFASQGIQVAGTHSDTEWENQFNAWLREFVETSRHESLTFIEPAEILSDFSGLDRDLIHPADAGMAVMGENLARKLEGFLT